MSRSVSSGGVSPASDGRDQISAVCFVVVFVVGQMLSNQHEGKKIL